MMKYDVVITGEAFLEIELASAWYRERSLWAAAKWHQRLMDAIGSLKTLPERCGLSPEGEALGLPIRQLPFGKRGGKYRILFHVKGETVRILRVRHGAQQLLGRE